MVCKPRGLLGCVTMAFLLASACACAQSSLSVDESTQQRLTGNPAPNAHTVVDHGRAPDALPLSHVLLLLRRSADREQALDSYISQQYDPHSPNYHKWLTPEQFGEQFGPSPTDITKLTQWLTQHGFVVNHVPAGGLFVDFSGDAGKIAQAFHTEIHRYRLGEEDHYANATDPSIPVALSPLISGFRALNDFHPRPQVHHLGVARFDRATATWSRAQPDHAHLTNPPGSNFPLYIAGPQDFATIYGIDQVWKEHATADASSPLLIGTGQTIGVVGETNPESADIQTFRDQFGITALGSHGSVETENPPANVCAAPDPAANEPESYLDAEWSGATAPDATIDFVACGRQGTTSGADLAAAYMIADPAHAQRISVLSTSYGDCEAQPQSEANQFYVSLWQQAAAEGITVVVAAGDAGGDGCAGVYTYSTDGLSVVNEASTPYNIAVGGTDFSDVFSGTGATYWSAANGPNYQSARSYIPEMAWNDTCASPLVLSTFGSAFSSVAGPNGFCTYASQQPIDENTGFPPYFFAFAGGGGLSTVSARPAWQAGVPGIPVHGGRAVPDISMFAAGGDTWSQTLIVCDSILVNIPAGTGCDFTNANDVFAGYGGGTSFVAPAFAGIVALIDQKSGIRQGQANYVLYPLAAAQYANKTDATQPGLAACAAYLGPQVSSGCYFHDISATPNPSAASPAFLTGNTAIPCTGTATATGTFTNSSSNPSSDSKNCYGYEITVVQNGASLITTPGYYGVLSTADNSSSPGFAAGPGYDLATGLGSPNVFALVNAPQWSAFSITTAGLPPARVGVAYAQTLSATGRVTPYTWSILSGSLPAGISLAPATGALSGMPAAAGSYPFTVQVADAEIPPATASATFTLAVPGFTATLNPTSLTIPFAGSGTATLSLSPQGGFAGPVTLSCGTLPLYFSCNFARPSITFAASAQTVTEVVTIHSAALPPAASAAIALWLPAGVALVTALRPKKRVSPLVLLCCSTVVILLVGGCGRGDHEAPEGTYTVPILLQAQGLASQTINLTVVVD